MPPARPRKDKSPSFAGSTASGILTTSPEKRNLRTMTVRPSPKRIPPPAPALPVEPATPRSALFKRPALQSLNVISSPARTTFGASSHGAPVSMAIVTTPLKRGSDKVAFDSARRELAKTTTPLTPISPPKNLKTTTTSSQVGGGSSNSAKARRVLSMATSASRVPSPVKEKTDPPAPTRTTPTRAAKAKASAPKDDPPARINASPSTRHTPRGNDWIYNVIFIDLSY